LVAVVLEEQLEQAVAILFYLQQRQPAAVEVGKQTQAMEQLEVLVVVEVINQTVALEIRQAQRQAKEIVEEMAMV